jgi:hypothetical protein
MAMTNQTNQAPAVTIDTDDPFPGIEARPLQLPDFVNLKPRNPLMVIRWVNRVAGEGQRLDEMTFAGFVQAKPEDVTMPDGKPVLQSFIRNGQVIRGDLIAMLLPKVTYNGALKYNWRRAISRLHPASQLKTGQNQLKRAVQQQGVPPSVGRTLASKLQAFRPGTSEKTADPNFLEDDSLPSEKKED